MEFLRSKKGQGANVPAPGTRVAGAAAEDRALAYLQQAGLALVQRNYRTAGRGGGEVDLIMREPDGTLVFVEVRSRGRATHGGAGASIGAVKRRRIVFAAQCFLLRWPAPPPCRFDAVLIDEGRLQWLRGAFEAC
ncbi:YraN family protein [Melaminivora sp.]|uniref:YraN family protein n=1 Tax=Melaminivora sp. TaxID=1933032 RepID=UPI0028A980BB|nr:YraN family protein [Melaminivora sp.]